MDITPQRVNIPLAAAQFRAAVSEYLAQSLGAQQNFINYFQHSEKQFFINGPYSIATLPVNGIDGMTVFEFQAQIIDVWMFNLVAGMSSSTQLDILVAGSSGTAFGSWTSIFSTKPSISSSATAPTWVACSNPQGGGSAYTPPSYTAPSGTTQGVLNTSVSGLIAPYTGIRCDLISAMPGGQNCGAVVLYRPV